MTNKELKTLYSDHGRETNLGIAYEPDYYNRRCFYKAGDKVAVLEDYHDDRKTACVECEVTKLCEPFMIMGSGGHVYYRRLHHETMMLRFPDGRTKNYSPQYVGVVGKLTTLDEYIRFMTGKDLKK